MAQAYAKAVGAGIGPPAVGSLTLNGEQRKAMADQIATVSKQRLQREIGRLDASDMSALERAVRVQLGL